MAAIRILLVEDHTLMRQGIRALLQSEPDFQIVGEASNGLEALRLVEDLTPHAMILDLMIPDLNGLEVTRRVHRIAPGVRIIIVSALDKIAYVAEAIRNGANAYVLKDSSHADLIRAVRLTLAGQAYFSPPFSEEALIDYIARMQNCDLDLYETLTLRERDILGLAAEGLTNNEIAQKLCISQRTVETHRNRMMHKLGLQNHAELMKFAISRGITALGENQRLL